jgi:quercetin dioxygenase-like cupin family protein
MTFELPIPERDDPRWTRADGIFVRRAEGITKWVMGDTTTVKITANQTNGALGVLETSVNPGSGAVAHSHGREEEAFYVLSGDFEFLNGDQTFAAGPGDFLFIPRGNRHGFTNIGSLPANLLTFMFPAGHEQFWIDNGDEPRPGEHPPKWGPEDLAHAAAELARHQVTLMPVRPQ